MTCNLFANMFCTYVAPLYIEFSMFDGSFVSGFLFCLETSIFVIGLLLRIWDSSSILVILCIVCALEFNRSQTFWYVFLVILQESLETVGQTLEEFGSSVWRGYVILSKILQKCVV